MTIQNSQAKLIALQDKISGRDRCVAVLEAAKVFGIDGDILLKGVMEGRYPAPVIFEPEPLWRVGDLADWRNRREEDHDALITGANTGLDGAWTGNLKASTAFNAEGMDGWLSRAISLGGFEPTHQITVTLNHAYDHPGTDADAIRKYNERVRADVECLARLLPRKIANEVFRKREFKKEFLHLIVGERFEKNRKVECPWHYHAILFLTEAERAMTVDGKAFSRCVKQWASHFQFIANIQCSMADLGALTYGLKNAGTEESLIIVSNIPDF